MKYIKLYEDLGGSYELVTYEYYLDKVLFMDPTPVPMYIDIDKRNSNWLDFTNDEIKVILKHFPGNYIMDPLPNSSIKESIICINNNLIHGHVIIYKMVDEWYYVSSYLGIYKCDQFEGLTSCLDYVYEWILKYPDNNTSINRNKRIAARKLYEDVNTYYSMISNFDEFESFLEEGNIIKLSESDISYIKNIDIEYKIDIELSNKLEAPLDKSGCPETIINILKHHPLPSFKSNFINIGYLWVYKDIDEWFYVQSGIGSSSFDGTYATFYKCDQLEGFKHFLIDLLIKNKELIDSYKS